MRTWPTKKLTSKRSSQLKICILNTFEVNFFNWNFLFQIRKEAAATRKGKGTWTKHKGQQRALEKLATPNSENLEWST